MTKKRPELNPAVEANLFKRTGPATPPRPAKQGKAKRGRPKVLDTTSPVGVPLEAAELERLNAMAAEVGVSRSALLAYAVRLFIKRWNEGERPKKRKKTVEELDI